MAVSMMAVLSSILADRSRTRRPSSEGVYPATAGGTRSWMGYCEGATTTRLRPDNLTAPDFESLFYMCCLTLDAVYEMLAGAPA